MVFCPDCGKRNEADAKFCIHCNKDLSRIPMTKWGNIKGGVIVIVAGTIWLLLGLFFDRLFFVAPIVIIIGIAILIGGLFMKSDHKCPKCGVQVPPGITHCINCGTLLQLASNK
jgi:hypothetical protein